MGKNCGSLPLLHLLSFSLSLPFYPLVHMQYRTIQCGRTGWRLMTGLVTRWHTKGQVSKNPPPQWDMCHGPAASPAFFVVSRLSALALSASGHNDKAPICCGDPGLSLSELIPHSSFPFVRYADQVSLLTPLCFTFATGTKVLLFLEEIYWKYDSHLFPKLCTPTTTPTCALVPPGKNCVFFFKRAEKQFLRNVWVCWSSLRAGWLTLQLTYNIPQSLQQRSCQTETDGFFFHFVKFLHLNFFQYNPQLYYCTAFTVWLCICLSITCLTIHAAIYLIHLSATSIHEAFVHS